MTPQRVPGVGARAEAWSVCWAGRPSRRLGRMAERVDIAVIGAGAAGLFASIWAGRHARSEGRSLSIVALDGARKLGAKILVAGGGRCNVTHRAVDKSDYAGSSRNAIGKVLRAFDVPQTISFFAELGVALKEEETGKLFPITDDAHTILNALLDATRDAGVQLRHPWRVGSVARLADGRFVITGQEQPGGQELPTITAGVVILATGGMALPKTGSDGAGYGFARALGHTVTPVVMPALVPLVLDARSFVRTLSGLTLPTRLEVRSGTGKKLCSFTNSTLCTHFGLSGPGPLDISRYYFDALLGDPGAGLYINWSPGVTGEELDRLLIDKRAQSPVSVLTSVPVSIPERLARALCFEAGVEGNLRAEHLPRESRRALVTMTTSMRLPVAESRGYTYAEVTAGGVPLSELHLATMGSRVTPGLYICGEICDVDGRIGGFNFQWAWASGYLAGKAAAGAVG
ncbi:MAG: aminoacetone oxidase family FAD-binding enzyme [bacterium]